MKILWISQERLDNPLAVACPALVNMRIALEQAGHQVIQVLGTMSGDGIRAEGNTLYWPVSTFKNKLSFNARTLRAILSTDADVVLLHQEFQVMVGLVAAAMRWLKRVPPIVMDIRTLPVHDRTTLVRKIRWLRFRLAVAAASRWLTGVTTIGPTMTEFLVENRWLRRERLLGEWSSGVGVDVEPADLPSDLAQQISSLPRPVGVYLGVLGENRGLEQLLEATSDAEFYGSLVLVGCGPIEARLRSHPVAASKNIVFTGKLPQKTAWGVLRRCDYGISFLPDLPWWRVSSPLKVLEYLAVGLPILASTSVHASLLDGYRGAKLIPDLAPSTIAEATRMMTGVQADEPQRRALLDLHSWETVAQELTAALEKALR